MSLASQRVSEFSGLGNASKAALLVSAFIGLAAGYSSTYFYSSGLFILSISKDLGLSRGQASTGPLVCSLAAALILPFLGRLLDRIGAVPIAILSLAGLAVGFFLMSAYSSSFSSYLLCSFAIALLGVGSTALPYSRLIIGAFTRRRGMAIGIMLTGTGVGALGLPLVLLPFIAAHGWRAAYGALGFLVLACAVVVAALLLPIRKALGAVAPQNGAPLQPVSLAGTLKSRKFVIVGTAFFALSISTVSVVVHFVPMLIDSGLTRDTAGRLAATIGFASLVARLSIGWLLDRFEPENITLSVVALTTFGLIALLFGGNTAALPAALIIGLVMGSEVDLLAFFTARLFPREQYGTAYSSLFSLYLIGGAIGPAGAGYLVDFTGSYKLALVLALAMLGVAATCIWSLRQPATEPQNPT